MSRFDVVVDGSDNFPTRYLVNDACVLAGKPNVYGSVYPLGGTARDLRDRGRAVLPLPLPRTPPAGADSQLRRGGVFGALPGVIGAAQAMEAIKLILGVGRPMIGRLQIFDALAYRWRELEIRRDPDCPVCGDEPTQKGLIDYEVFCGAEPGPPEAEERVGHVGAEELDEVLSGSPRPFLLDVREPMEWNTMNLAHMGPCWSRCARCTAAWTRSRATGPWWCTATRG